MPYIEAKTVAGKTVEIEKYYTYRYHKKGEKREKKLTPTREEQKRINTRNAEKKLRRILNANFKGDDIHLILTYQKDNRPQNKEDLKKNIRKFLDALRKEYKKQGRELKYIHVAEIGKRGAVHHHLVINYIEQKIITKLWNKGRPKMFPLDDTGQYEKLASYLIKETCKNIGEDEEEKIQSKRWDSSRNLIHPETKKRIVPVKNGFNPNPKERKGYYIDKGSINYGISEYTGYPYLSYTLIKNEIEMRD